MSRPKSRVAAVDVVGPLAPFAQQFTALLAERGYTPWSRVNQLRVMVCLSKWMRAGDLDVVDLTFERVEEFLAQRRADGRASFCSRASLSQLLDCLGGCGAPLLVEPAAPSSDIDVLLAGFARYLRQERALAASTTTAYVLRARRLVTAYGHGADLAGLGHGDVTRAVLREADRVSAGSVQMFVVALRSFLRYGYLTDLIRTDLSGAALPVTGRRRSTLPQGISPAGARALLKSCDRRTPMGRRDYAVILILLRLGIRACEVAGLQLGDIDWRAGQLTVHGKRGRVDQLPLPIDVGQAIAAYLRHARPRNDRREVFLKATAPLTGLQRRGVSLIVRRACTRAGLEPCGSHRLRHSLACDMVRAGVPLQGIGQVLRHRDATSTSIYARRYRPVADGCPSLAPGGDPVSTMQTHLAEYLRLRRALGFQLVWPGHVLSQFVTWLEDTGSEAITTKAAIAWARLSTAATPMTLSHRLGAVRGFARYLRSIDPTTEVPPTGVFGRQRRIIPYIYSPDEIGRLVQAARGLHPPLRAATHEALLGLLGASGMRVGEALRLRCEDVDLVAGVIRVRHGKFDRDRLVPLHPTTTEALRGYTVRRDRLCPQPSTDAFFVSTVGSALRYERVRSAFGVLLVSAGLPTTPGARPRIHDLRHSMVVNTLIDWQREGVDVASRLPVLSTYLGHVNPASTYWYISAVPELMQLAAEGLHRRLGDPR